MDDYATIIENPSLRNWRDVWAVLSPPPGLPTGGRPLANLSFALNYAWGGTQPTGYHVMNLAIHIGAALLLFGIVRRTFVARWPDAATVIAAGAAVMWALHPLQTTSVTYLAQRTESLAGLCYLATLYAFIRSADGRRPWRVVSIACCALAMLSKETAITAPLVVLLYDRTFVAFTFGAALRQRRAYYGMLALTWLLVIPAFLGGMRQRAVGFELGVSPWHYALTQSQSVLIYSRLSLWPHPLIFDYGPFFLNTFSAALPFVAALSIALAAVGLALWRWPAVGFGGAAYFVLLAPTSSFIPLASQPTAENRMYLPVACIVATAAVAIYRVLGPRLLVAVIATASAFAVLTAVRNHYYQSDVSLWADTVAKRPGNPRAYDNIGLALCRAGKPAAAIPYLAKALEMNPNSAPSQTMMGNACFFAGRLDDAALHYSEAVRLNPQWSNPRFNLGVVYRQLGRPREAIPHFDLLLRSDPENADLYWNMALALAALHETGAALRYLGEAVRLAPQRTDVWNSYARVLAQAGRLNDAIAAYQRSLRIDPRQAEIEAELARVTDTLRGAKPDGLR